MFYLILIFNIHRNVIIYTTIPNVWVFKINYTLIQQRYIELQFLLNLFQINAGFFFRTYYSLNKPEKGFHKNNHIHLQYFNLQ